MYNRCTINGCIIFVKYITKGTKYWNYKYFIPKKSKFSEYKRVAESR